jgi:hypothetical protein
LDSAFDKRADANLPGSPLRNEAASYLEAIYGNASVEILIEGKKVDIICDVIEHGKKTHLFVEVKDYAANLGRDELAKIYADHEPIVSKHRGSRLLVVTRRGLSPSSQAYADSHDRIFHQTIWELEDSAFGLLPYIRAQADVFDEDGLSSYYIPARARVAAYDSDYVRSLEATDIDLFDAVQAWIAQKDTPPLAVLGGYGAGKSSFAKRLLAFQAKKALENPEERRPILIKLGNITRSSGLDSLLGSLFTSEHEVRGYSFRRFKDLNKKGRLVIILDGFDEMKHAMTWTEFLNEIEELNQLNCGDSKVILLGRPSAFTSDDEHIEVLKGVKRSDLGVRKLLNWPDFREIELEPFTRTEREEFVRKFLSYAHRRRDGQKAACSGEEFATVRAAEVNRLADLEDEVFRKPVHAKILVELALDADFDLTKFSSGITRWTLYAEFFDLLARRETQKAARSPIEARYRLQFLRKLASWLWINRDGSTSFRAAEIPKWVFDGLPDGDAQSVDDKRREYLAGSFLERKANDIFFFPHRSFAEFLVADHLATSPPTESDHVAYGALLSDGVLEFLESAPTGKDIAAWLSTLSENSGVLDLDYIFLLTGAAGGFRNAVAKVPVDSPWRALFSMFGTNENAIDEQRQILADTLLTGSFSAIRLLLVSMARFPELIPSTLDKDDAHELLQDFSSIVAAGLISRVIGSVREKQPMARLTVNNQNGPILTIAKSCISITKIVGTRHISFSWSKLAQECSNQASRTGPLLARKNSKYPYMEINQERMPYVTIRQLLNLDVSNFFHDFIVRGDSLNSISVVSGG